MNVTSPVPGTCQFEVHRVGAYVRNGVQFITLLEKASVPTRTEKVFSFRVDTADATDEAMQSLSLVQPGDMLTLEWAEEFSRLRLIRAHIGTLEPQAVRAAL